MPFFDISDNQKVEPDREKGQPLSVIAVYNPDGKIKPLYISLTDLYGNVCKTKIDGVKYTKDGKGYKTYCCLYNDGYRQQQINLTFYIDKHFWILDETV